MPIARAYERIVFDKDLINPPGYPLADFVCPGHPLLDATVDVLLGQQADLLRRGAVLIDPSIASEAARVLVYLEHTITDQRLVHGSPQVVSRRWSSSSCPLMARPARRGRRPTSTTAPPAARRSIGCGTSLQLRG